MSICVRQSGTWRDITKATCVKQSGTWRASQCVCINQSGSWRQVCCYGPYNGALSSCPLGSSVEGGNLMCKSGGIAYIVAPKCADVSGTVPTVVNNAISCAQTCTGCTGWFYPSFSRLQNMYSCRSYWDYYAESYTSNEPAPPHADRYYQVNMGTGAVTSPCGPYYGGRGRAMRCVSY